MMRKALFGFVLACSLPLGAFSVQAKDASNTTGTETPSASANATSGANTAGVAIATGAANTKGASNATGAANTKGASNATGAANLSVLESFLITSKSAEGKFTQETFDKSGKRMEDPSSGQFKFLKPGRFEWVYEQPYQQTILCDGKSLYVWDRDLEQVTIRPAQSSLPQSPASILFGQESLQKDWKTLSVRNVDGLQLFTLAPKKPESSVKTVTFGFKGNQLESLDVNGSMGEETKIRFEGIRTDVKLSPKDFEFKIPKGADVVRMQ